MIKKRIAIGLAGAMLVLGAGVAVPTAANAATPLGMKNCYTVKVAPKWPWYKCINLLPGSTTSKYCNWTTKTVC